MIHPIAQRLDGDVENLSIVVARRREPPDHGGRGSSLRCQHLTGHGLERRESFVGDWFLVANGVNHMMRGLGGIVSDEAMRSHAVGAFGEPTNCEKDGVLLGGGESRRGTESFSTIEISSKQSG